MISYKLKEIHHMLYSESSSKTHRLFQEQSIKAGANANYYLLVYKLSRWLYLLLQEFKWYCRDIRHRGNYTIQKRPNKPNNIHNVALLT